jgi:hypothetical protein
MSSSVIAWSRVQAPHRAYGTIFCILGLLLWLPASLVFLRLWLLLLSSLLHAAVLASLAASVPCMLLRLSLLSPSIQAANESDLPGLPTGGRLRRPSAAAFGRRGGAFGDVARRLRVTWQASSSPKPAFRPLARRRRANFFARHAQTCVSGHKAGYSQRRARKRQQQ